MYLCLVLFVLFLVFINIHTLCTSADSLEHSLLDTAIKNPICWLGPDVCHWLGTPWLNVRFSFASTIMRPFFVSA